MEKWICEPNIIVGVIKFGEIRENIREIIGREYVEFKKSKYSKNTTDDFGNFHVYYDENNKCEAVEIFENIELVIDGNTIYPGNVENLIKHIEGFENNGYGYINKEKSIGFTNNNDEIESVLIGKLDYYK